MLTLLEQELCDLVLGWLELAAGEGGLEAGWSVLVRFR